MISEGSPLMVAALLYGGAATALLLVRGFLGHRLEESPVQRHHLPPLLGLTLLSAGSASLLLNLEAVFTLSIAMVIGREHLSRKGLIAAVLIVGGAVLLTEDSLHGVHLLGTLLILALAVGQSLPSWSACLGLLVIGALGYGFSIWLDLLALRHLGAARESVVCSRAPFVGVLFSALVLREAFTSGMAIAPALMLMGIALLLKDDYAHCHRHAELRHAHRHRHDPTGGEPHHSHEHTGDETLTRTPQGPYCHAHVSDVQHPSPTSSQSITRRVAQWLTLGGSDSTILEEICTVA